MTTEEYRIEMTSEEFSRLRFETNDRFDGILPDRFAAYYVYFFLENKKANRLSIKDIRDKLSNGLKLLIFASIFEAEVSNGGITQFFWNYPEMIVDIYELFEILGEVELRDNYETACENLTGNEDNWRNLREMAHRDEKDSKWAPFAESYDLLDLGWFDDLYSAKYERESNGEYILKRPGLRTNMLEAIADYVESHPDEFIVPPK
jgi:hypothetical protein